MTYRCTFFALGLAAALPANAQQMDAEELSKIFYDSRSWITACLTNIRGEYYRKPVCTAFRNGISYAESTVCPSNTYAKTPGSFLAQWDDPYFGTSARIYTTADPVTGESQDYVLPPAVRLDEVLRSKIGQSMYSGLPDGMSKFESTGDKVEYVPITPQFWREIDKTFAAPELAAPPE